MSLFDILAKFNRSDFPDLAKAEKAVSLDKVITPGKPPAALAEKEQQKQQKQLVTDFASFQMSLVTATSRGNENSCTDKHQHETVDQQLGQWKVKQIPKGKKQPTKPYRASLKKKLPKPAPTAPGGRPAVSLNSSKVNYGAVSGRPQAWTVPTIKPKLDTAKQERVASQFVKAQAGQRGTAVGDAAVVFGTNGTPYPGDSYLDRSNLQNQSANLASSTPPVTQAPTTIKTKVVSNGVMKRGANGQVAPQSNTVGNIAALLGIAAVVSAIMFALQYVIQIVSFIFNIQNLLVTCNNIAGSFAALFNTIGSLLGLGEDVSKPLTDTMDGLLNSAFGKEKVDYVKYQWAKVSSAVSAAGNVINSVRSASNVLGNAVEIGTNNTGRIGNGLKAAGFFDQTIATFDENVSATQQKSKLTDVNNALQVADGASSALSQAAADIKSGNQELEQIDKDFEEKKKETEKNTTSADKKYGAEATPDVPNFKPGDI
jgi:hypothetical protein